MKCSRFYIIVEKEKYCVSSKVEYKKNYSSGIGIETNSKTFPSSHIDTLYLFLLSRKLTNKTKCNLNKKRESGENKGKFEKTECVIIRMLIQVKSGVIACCLFFLHFLPFHKSRFFFRFVSVGLIWSLSCLAIEVFVLLFPPKNFSLSNEEFLVRRLWSYNLPVDRTNLILKMVFFHSLGPWFIAGSGFYKIIVLIIDKRR